MKKGLTQHHLSYSPSVIVRLPSKGSHLVIVGIQKMKASKENIEYLDNIIKSILFEKWRMESQLKNFEYEKRKKRKLGEISSR